MAALTTALSQQRHLTLLISDRLTNIGDLEEGSGVADGWQPVAPRPGEAQHHGHKGVVTLAVEQRRPQHHRLQDAPCTPPRRE